jgi:hypothetical protein
LRVRQLDVRCETKTKVFSILNSVWCLICALLMKLLPWSKNILPSSSIRTGFYLFRTMSLSLLLHLSNIALSLKRHLTPSTSWATLGNKSSRMYLMVSVLSVWNHTLCV